MRKYVFYFGNLQKKMINLNKDLYQLFHFLFDIKKLIYYIFFYMYKEKNSFLETSFILL